MKTRTKLFAVLVAAIGLASTPITTCAGAEGVPGGTVLFCTPGGGVSSSFGWVARYLK